MECVFSLQKIDKGPQGRWDKLPARVIKIWSREPLPPRLEYWFKLAAFKMWAQPILEKNDNAEAVEGRFDAQVRRSPGTVDQLSFRLDAVNLLIPLILPNLKVSAAEASADPIELHQVPWLFRPAVSIEVRRRRCSCKALIAWPDRDGDHVLVKPVIVPDPSIAACRKHINQIGLSGDVHANAGMLLRKRRQTNRQEQSRCICRYVQAQYPCRLVPRGGNILHRVLQFRKRGQCAIEEALALLCGQDAARRSMKKPYP
ncbi:hypothetical protein SAMN03159288_04660 [Rhizobium sp. NFACC06-2]|nr:hypothetical protein SAMN03159288_04660 [Rhizobium sp. NFACC06-2]